MSCNGRLWAALFTLVVQSPPIPAAAPPRLSWPIDAGARQRLDTLALQQKLPRPPEEHRNLVGTVPAFLITRLSLPAEVELRRSRAVQENLLVRERTAPTPAAAARVLRRLAAEVPAYQRPAELRFTLTVLEGEECAVSTPGGGYLHITRPLLERLAADKERGESALAFVLAREVAHTALGHCRRGWQVQLLEEDARRGIESTLAPSVWRDLLETKVHCTGNFVQFLYSQNQEFHADLYALHLCRNAGFELDAAIDGLRQLAVRSPSEVRVPFLRLKRLLQERDGKVEPEEKFGLFAYDRAGARLVRCRDAEVPAAARPIVFAHGLHGDEASWFTFLRYFGGQKELEGRPLLVFRHPSNGSLARSGRLLWNEVRRVLAAPARATFVCHSAGGLAFRWYAEKLGGRFDRAVFLATPHRGSDLTNLKFLFDLLQFAGALRLGLTDGVARVLAEGRGEIALDLHPDSLFLRHLGSDRELAQRYHAFHGEYLGPVQALALRTTFTAVRQEAKPQLLRFVPEGLYRKQAETLLDRLTLPAEVLSGDGLVAAGSGKLEGAAANTKLRLWHGAFNHDERAMALVLEVIK